jgi:hypothetical protein
LDYCLMARLTYKAALRAKGIKPLPAAHKLRSSLTVMGETIDATRALIEERTGIADFKRNPR